MRGLVSGLLVLLLVCDTRHVLSPAVVIRLTEFEFEFEFDKSTVCFLFLFPKPFQLSIEDVCTLVGP